MFLRRLVLSSTVALLATVSLAGVSHATHAWGCYHWARSSNPFTVAYGNNLTSNWAPYLTTGVSDWSITSGACNNASNPVRATVVSGGANAKNCRPRTGNVEVCNSTYGNTGWLGIAQIWVSGCHITKGSVKVNDTYFNTPTYNTPAWHSFVMDQEMGHILGLDHQDTDFNNPDLLDGCGRGSCMDYSADPSNNTTPNQHDYDELVIIYSHFDGVAAPVAATSPDEGVDLDDPSAWGQAMRSANGRAISYERDLGNGNKILTYVIWAQ